MSIKAAKSKETPPERRLIRMSTAAALAGVLSGRTVKNWSRLPGFPALVEVNRRFYVDSLEFEEWLASQRNGGPAHAAS